MQAKIYEVLKLSQSILLFHKKNITLDEEMKNS